MGGLLAHDTQIVAQGPVSSSFRPDSRVILREVVARLRTLLALLVGLAQCGRPATEAECRRILEKGADLAPVASGTSEAPPDKKPRAWLDDHVSDLLKLCVGRKLTDSTLRCIDGASTAAELDACLN